jgi:hypothetical protein
MHSFQDFIDSILPGVIRIEIPPLDDVDPDLRAVVTVDLPGKATAWGFNLAKGFRGEYFGAGFRQYEIRVETIDFAVRLASASITLSPERPEVDVKLSVRVTR